jgi:hypothetical protein
MRFQVIGGHSARTVRGVLIAVTLLFPLLAQAGRLQNPLPLYTDSGETLWLRFDKSGVEFQGRTHEFVGRKTYLATTTAGPCHESGTSRQTFELRFMRDQVRYTRTDYRGCQTKKTPVLRVIRYRYLLVKPTAQACTVETVHLERNGQNLSVTKYCNGTLALRDSSGWQEVLSQKGQAFVSRGRGSTTRWKVTVRPPKRGRKGKAWRVTGSVIRREKSGAVTLRFRGLYRPVALKNMDAD